MYRFFFYLLIPLMLVQIATAQLIWTNETWGLQMGFNVQPNADEVYDIPANYSNQANSSYRPSWVIGYVEFNITISDPENNVDDEGLVYLVGNTTHPTTVAIKQETVARAEWLDPNRSTLPWRWVVSQDGTRWQRQHLDVNIQNVNCTAPQKPQIQWRGWASHHFGQIIYHNGNTVDGLYFTREMWYGSATCNPNLPVYE